MKINSKDKIAGFPLLKIRDLLKRNHTLNTDIVEYFIKTNKATAKRVLEELTELGYIEVVADKNFYSHEITLQGSSFSLAKAIMPISKEKANQLFEKFMQRVYCINSDNYYLYKVNKVLLFGSFISDKVIINDIDIAIELIRKESNKDIAFEKEQQRTLEAKQKGKIFNNYSEELYYPTREVVLFLKARSPYLSIHDTDDGILKTTQVKQIFPS